VQVKSEENLSFLKRVEKLRFSNDLTIKEVCAEMGISPVMIHHIKHGTNSVTAKTWFKLEKAEHTLKGEDPSSLERFSLRDSPEPAPRYNAGPYWGLGKGAPIISMASAGRLHSWEDMGHDVPIIPTLCKDENCYAVEITGDSMEPVYDTGDVAVVAPNSEARQGDLVVAKTVDEEPVFKKLKFSTDLKMVRLFSFNPEYPVIELKRSQVRFLHPVYSVTRFFQGRP